MIKLPSLESIFTECRVTTKPKEGVIYFLYDDELDISYVGRTINLYKRLDEHHKRGRPFDDFRVYLPQEEYKHLLGEMEKFYIHLAKPYTNVQKYSGFVNDKFYIW